MSICQSGLACKVIRDVSLTISVATKHPLIKLANQLDWQQLAALVMPDLKSTTTKFKWWLGRKLKLRVHLAVFLLQQLLNQTDRGIEKAITYNAAYQVFCGKTVVENWTCPDHTKIEEFRSRLSPKTQCRLANAIAVFAMKYGFAQPQQVDIDSTVQEPDMQYPSGTNLLIKTANLAKRIQVWCTKYLPDQAKKIPRIDLKKLRMLAREYYFKKRLKQNKSGKENTKVLQKIWQQTSQAALPILNLAKQLKEPFLYNSLPKRQQHLIQHFARKAPVILSDLFNQYFMNGNKPLKIYSYFRDAIQCFNKMKLNKKYEFGRQFQLGRLRGNFVYSIPNSCIRMPDAASLKPMLMQHIETFQTPIESLATDKAYYSKANEKLALDFKIEKIGIQRPRRKLEKPPDNPTSLDDLVKLSNRRSGIEPIIGHLKRHWQLGRSRMKSDRATQSSGFCAMLGFNLRQMMRCLEE